jgi:Calx-beta domain
VEPGFDGGNLKISVNGGPFQLVPPSQFSFNNYTLILLSAADGNTNPLAGQPAWSGTNVGSIGGSWGRTHVDLGNFAPPGSNVLRWDLGIDQCSARKGWYLDNVNVFSCVPNVPVVTIDPVASAPEASGAVVFTILLSAPTIVPVAVTVETVDGSAIHGNDFDRIAGTVVIPASSATSLVRGVFVQVPVKDDKVSEGDESFTFRITNVSNGTLDTNNATATGTILDDD